MNKTEQLDHLKKELAALYKQQDEDLNATIDKIVDEAVTIIQQKIVDKDVIMSSPTSFYVEFRFPRPIPEHLNRLWITRTGIPEKMEEEWGLTSHDPDEELRPNTLEPEKDVVLYTYWFSFDES